MMKTYQNLLALICLVLIFSACDKKKDKLEESSTTPEDVAAPHTPAWTLPSGFSDHASVSGQDVHLSKVRTDGLGNVVVAWVQSNGTNKMVYKSEYRNGAWTHPTSLSETISPAGQDVTELELTVGKNGDAIIAWIQNAGTIDQVYKSEYRNGVWTHPSNLADNISPTSNGVSYVRAAMDKNGNSIIVWAQVDAGPHLQIFKSEYRNGTWTHPSSDTNNISPDTTHATMPVVAMSDNGDAVISWVQDVDTGGNYLVYKSDYRNGTWTHPTGLNDHIQPTGTIAVAAELGSRVAMDKNGNSLITWAGKDSNNDDQIFKSEYRNGAWTHPADGDDNISPNNNWAMATVCAMSDDGSAIIVYAAADPNADWRYFKSEYRDGAWSHATSNTQFFTGISVPTNLADLRMNASGNAILTWLDSNTSGVQVFIAQYKSGVWTVPAGTDDHLSIAGQAASNTNVDLDDNGNIILAWIQSDGTNSNLYLGEYW